MKNPIAIALALILSVFFFGAGQKPAAAGIPAVGAAQNATVDDGAVIKVMHGGGGGGFGHGGMGFGPRGFGHGFGHGGFHHGFHRGFGPVWGLGWGWDDWGPYCSWHCNRWRCWRTCW